MRKERLCRIEPYFFSNKTTIFELYILPNICYNNHTHIYRDTGVHYGFV